jgi:beta-lactamase superfamily II metal-dependent hydrolase
VTPAERGGVELTGPVAPRVTLLSPTPSRLADLYRVWAKELERLRKKEREPADPEPRVTRGERLDLEALAARVAPTDRAVPNGSSIALPVEHRGASVLLAGDAFADVLAPALRAVAQRRGLPGPMQADALELSHHGSRANVTPDSLRAVAAHHFIVSTNNSYFRRPDDEAVARVITGSGAPTIWFNYDTPRNRKWDSPAHIERHG